MLEKDKNCIEFSMHSMTATHKPYQEDTEIAITGMAPGKSLLRAKNPFDIPCDVVVVPKRYFDRLQADDQHYRELAKQQEENYKLLLEKTGFTSETDLIDYIHDPSMTSPEDKTLREIIDECEEDYISERNKAEVLQTENEQLKKKLEEFSPVPGYMEFLKALYPEATEATIEKLVWTTGQLCCGRDLRHALQVDLEYYRALSSSQAKSVYNWKEATGCSTPEEAKELIDGKKRHIEKRETLEKENIDLKKENDEFARKNQELIEKRETLEKEIQVYSRALQEWKEITGCPSSSAAKTLIESGMSWYYAYNEIKEKNRKLEEENNELRADYSHLLLTTGFESEGEIEDALDKCDHSSLRKALVDYEFDYEALLKLTGYKSERDIRDALRGEKFPYQTMRDLINSLRRKAKWNL